MYEKTMTGSQLLILAILTMVVLSIIPINASALTRNVEHAAPTLSPSTNKTIVDVALSVPALQNWSHDWKYVSMAYLGNNNPSNFQWQYAMVYLKAPSSSAPVPCDSDWDAEITVDMTTMKVVSATYPTMKLHNCDNYATGGGPGTESTPSTQEQNASNTSTNHTINNMKGITFASSAPSIIKNGSPLQQSLHGTTPKNVICKQGLELVFKAEDDSPACVQPDTSSILIERGWAKASQS